MNLTFSRENIGKGIFFSTVKDEKFKTNRITVNLIVPLDKNMASENAIVPCILRKGYKECSDFTELNKKLDELYGAVVDADIRKLGDSQIVSLSITALDDKFAIDNEPVALKCSEILCKMLLDPYLPDGKFDKPSVELEKQFLIDSIDAQINDKIIYAKNRCIELMCKDEPFGIDKYGCRERVEKIDAEVATKAYFNLIKRAQIEIMFIGGGDALMCRDMFIKYFDNIERNEIYKNEISDGNIPEKEKTVEEKMNINQAKLVFGFRLKALEEQTSALRVMIALYGGTPFSKLFLNVRERLSLCYYCGASYDRIKNLMFVNCGVEEENYEKAKNEIISQLQSVKNGEFSDSEIENTVKSLANSFYATTDSMSGVENWYLGQIFCKTSFSPAEEAEKLSNITKQDIMSAAQNVVLDTVYYLHSNN